MDELADELEDEELLLLLEVGAEVFAFDSRMASAKVPSEVEIIEATRTAVTDATNVPIINFKPSLLNTFMFIPPYGIRIGFF
jgi:hypothetical protein